MSVVTEFINRMMQNRDTTDRTRKLAVLYDNAQTEITMLRVASHGFTEVVESEDGEVKVVIMDREGYTANRAALVEAGKLVTKLEKIIIQITDISKDSFTQVCSRVPRLESVKHDQMMNIMQRQMFILSLPKNRGVSEEAALSSDSDYIRLVEFWKEQVDQAQAMHNKYTPMVEQISKLLKEAGV